MKDPELEILIEELETRSDLSVAEFDGVLHALAFVLPKDRRDDTVTPRHLATTDGAIEVADDAYPDWFVQIRGRANDRDGHWGCVLRESESADDDAVIGTGRSPVLGQAILAAVLRLAMTQSKKAPSA